MKKRVNVHAKIPVRTIRPAMFGDYKNIELDTNTIFTLMCARAQVVEILDNGTLLPLNIKNYDKDNNPKVVEPAKEEKKEKKVPHIKKTEPKELEETQTVEVKEEVIEAINDNVAPVEEIIVEEAQPTEVEEETVEPANDDAAPVEETVAENTVVNNQTQQQYHQNRKNKNRR